MRTKTIIKDRHKGKKSIKHPFFYSTLTKKERFIHIFPTVELSFEGTHECWLHLPLSRLGIA